MTKFGLRLIALIVASVFSCFSIIAQDTLVHKVERGETLTTIAKKYGTTESKIIELNPEAAQFVYVGMELNIPNTQVKPVEEKPQPKQQQPKQPQPKQPQKEVAEETKAIVDEPVNVGNNANEIDTRVSSQDTGNTNPYLDNTRNSTINSMYVEGGFGILGKHKDTIDLSMGGRWVFPNYVVVSGALMWRMYTFSQTEHYYNERYEIKTDYNFLGIPLKLGYYIPFFAGHGAIYPNLGFDTYLCITGKSKFNEEKQDCSKPDLGVDFNIGLNLNFYSVELFARYDVPLTNEHKGIFKKGGYLIVGFGYGFEL